MPLNKQLSIKKIILILSLFILVLLSLRLVWIDYFKAPIFPIAEQGILDLSNLDLNDKDTIALDGEWEFYPNEFIQSSTIPESKSQTISVPGNWKRTANEEFGFDSNHGYGSYRLQVLLPEDNRRLFGLRIKEIYTSANIFINGKEIIQIGEPTDSKNTIKGKLISAVESFELDNNRAEIIIHVANFEVLSLGGITGTIKFGTSTAINNEVHLVKMMQFSVFFVLLFHCIFAISLYVLGTRKRALLYFSLLLLAGLLSVIVDDDRIIMSFIPLNITWSLKLLMLSYTNVAFFMYLHIKSILKLNNSKIHYLFISFYTIIVFSIILLPLEFLYYTNSIRPLLSFSLYFYMLYIVFQHSRKKDSNSIYLLLALAAILVNVIWGSFKNYGLLDVIYYPFDFIIAIMLFAFFLFKQHIQIANQNEDRANKLEKLDIIRSEFLANTSHELRNPLHGMINIAKYILENEGKSLSAENRGNLSLLINIGSRMGFTLNDLNDITQLKAGVIRLNKSNVRIQSLTSGVLDMLSFMKDGKKIEFDLRISEEFPSVLADENRLIQILFNLIHNAIKFTNEGHITIEATHDYNVATIYIKDTGVGIDPNKHEQFFEPYEQENNDLTSIGTGVGIGLSICRNLVELHGGTLSIESPTNLANKTGTTFSFTLPLANSEVEIKTQSETEIIYIEESTLTLDDLTEDTTAIEDNKQQAMILIVDDDPVNIKVLQQTLSKTYHIVAALSGDEALKQLEIHKFDLIISDVMMPHMSGYELTQTIRENFTPSELPILLLTARGLSEDIHIAFHSGANDYLIKPVDPLELKARVGALINLKLSVKQLLHMEAAWLQSQIHPHFLFNTLNSIASLAEVDTGRMITLLEKFGEYLKGSFSNRNTDAVVPIEKEIHLTCTYLYIEKERFGDRMDAKWDIDANITTMIPPLSIQPLVENAVMHGILKKIIGGTILIQIKDVKDQIRISIKDNGVGMTQNKIDNILESNPISLSGVGLANTNRRLKQLYGKGLYIDSTVGEGTTITFYIPKQ